MPTISHRSALRDGGHACALPTLRLLMQTSGKTCRENAASCSVVIVREGGRSSIPETLMIEPISHGVLDPRLRGDDIRDGARLSRTYIPR